MPKPARNAVQAVRTLLKHAQRDGTKVHFEEQRIGLEGEVRLCIQFPDKKIADELMQRIRRVVEGVDLVRLIEEPCPNSEPRN